MRVRTRLDPGVGVVAYSLPAPRALGDALIDLAIAERVDADGWGYPSPLRRNARYAWLPERLEEDIGDQASSTEWVVGASDALVGDDRPLRELTTREGWRRAAYELIDGGVPAGLVHEDLGFAAAGSMMLVDEAPRVLLELQAPLLGRLRDHFAPMLDIYLSSIRWLHEPPTVGPEHAEIVIVGRARPGDAA